MEALWNEVQNLKRSLGKYEIKTIGQASLTASVSFDFIPNYIFVIAQGSYNTSKAVLKAGPIKNGSSARSSFYYSSANNVYFDASLSNKTATITASGYGGTKVNSILILAF